MRSITPFRFEDDPSRLFCSQLVAVAYERAGATLVEGKEARQITPKLLHENSTLRALPCVPIRAVIDRNIPPLDRDAGYAGSATARDLHASRNAFKAVEPEMKVLVDTLSVTPEPGSLIELLQLLKQAEARAAKEDVAPVMKALEQALEQEKYFDLPKLAIEAEAAFLNDLSFAESPEATVDEREDLARRSAELARTYEGALSRHEANSRWYEEAMENSQEPLWRRLTEMSCAYATATKKLIEVAQDVSRKCTSPCPNKLG